MTSWPLGITSGPVVEPSALDVRLDEIGASRTATWTYLHTTHRDLFGRVQLYECGVAPPIYRLLPLMDDFVAASSDAELLAFVEDMQTGSEAEQEAAVEAAGERALAWLEARRAAK